MARKKPKLESERLHDLCSSNRRKLAKSGLAVCFYCFKEFPPKAIKEWCLSKQNGPADCALCPHCGIDSVLPSRNIDPVQSMLKLLHEQWFDRSFASEEMVRKEIEGRFIDSFTQDEVPVIQGRTETIAIEDIVPPGAKAFLPRSHYKTPWGTFTIRVDFLPQPERDPTDRKNRKKK